MNVQVVKEVYLLQKKKSRTDCVQHAQRNANVFVHVGRACLTETWTDWKGRLAGTV